MTTNKNGLSYKRLVGSKSQAEVIPIDLDCKRKKRFRFVHNSHEHSTREYHALTIDTNLVTANENGLSYKILVGSKNQSQVISIDIDCKRRKSLRLSNNAYERSTHEDEDPIIETNFVPTNENGLPYNSSDEVFLPPFSFCHSISKFHLSNKFNPVCTATIVNFTLLSALVNIC